MEENILEHYRKTSTYTYAGAYGEYFRSLPDDIPMLGRLVCGQVIHRVTLKEGNTNANATLLYGDMDRYPWYRMRCEDDVLLTAPAMTAELFRMDGRGFVRDRKTEDKIVVTCRYVSVLMSAILKAKGIPARCRAGFAPYFREGVSMDHWINQYYSREEGRWITFDADGFYEESGMPLTQYDIPQESFDWAAQAYLAVRRGETDGKQFLYADCLGTCSLPALIRYLIYDFHALMNQEAGEADGRGAGGAGSPCRVDGGSGQVFRGAVRALGAGAEAAYPEQPFGGDIRIKNFLVYCNRKPYML